MAFHLRNLLLLLALSAFVIVVDAGCTTIVGDACTTQEDCGQELFCERSLPEGYCTNRGCEISGCPAESVCVTYYQSLPEGAGAGAAISPDYDSWCMRTCAADIDCRDGYRCVMDYGPHPFCADAGGVTP